jgi:hypothetical protein
MSLLSAEMKPSTSALRPSVETSVWSDAGVTTRAIPGTDLSSFAAIATAGPGTPLLGATSSSTSGIGRRPVASRSTS